MNSGNLPLIITQMDCNSAVMQMTMSLKTAGYQVMKSFDLDSIRSNTSECNCNPNNCACKLVVLLIYAIQGPPFTLIIDSNDAYTEVYLENNSQNSLKSGWIGKLTQILTTSLSTLIPINPQNE